MTPASRWCSLDSKNKSIKYKQYMCLNKIGTHWHANVVMGNFTWHHAQMMVDGCKDRKEIYFCQELTPTGFPSSSGHLCTHVLTKYAKWTWLYCVFLGFAGLKISSLRIRHSITTVVMTFGYLLGRKLALFIIQNIHWVILLQLPDF